MDMRVIAFLVISLVILFGYDVLLKEMGLIPSPPPPEIEEQQAPELQGEEAADSSGVIDNQQEEELLSSGEALAVAAGDAADMEQQEEVDTPLFHAVLSNRGAEIRNWKLKEYLTQDPEDPRPVDLVYPEGHFTGPLALQVADPELTKQLQEGLYEVDRDFSTLDAAHPVGHLTFTYRVPDRGVWVRKTLTFRHDTYMVDVSVKTEGLSDDVEVLLGTNFGIVEWGQGFIGLIGAAWKLGDDVEKEAPEPEIRRTGDLRWAALQDKYFISAIIPTEASGVVAHAEGERLVSAGVQFDSSVARDALAFQLYAGPKQFDRLKTFQIGLEDTIDFGWFIYGSWKVVRAVAKPLFSVLRFLYDYTQNYGFAIVLLTLGIKLLFVPLQYKSYKSMQGMQQIQPKVVALQTKYKDDRERLNKELMKLYREHKVNPVGGCLPMFLQMPVFIALFNILYMTVDLRQAPFILWISDLSVADPYFVLPVLMGASMLLQQKIMPTTMDPTQAKMMLLLPVFLTFLFMSFAAGLVLYWLTNNVLTITQQFVTDRYIYKRPTFSSGPPTDTPEPSDGNKEPGKKNKGKAERQEKDSQNKEEDQVEV